MDGLEWGTPEYDDYFDYLSELFEADTIQGKEAFQLSHAPGELNRENAISSLLNLSWVTEVCGEMKNSQTDGPGAFTIVLLDNNGAWEGLRNLRQYLSREGDLTVPFGHVENGFLLGAWLLDKIKNFERHTSFSKNSEKIAAIVYPLVFEYHFSDHDVAGRW